MQPDRIETATWNCNLNLQPELQPVVTETLIWNLQIHLKYYSEIKDKYTCLKKEPKILPDYLQTTSKFPRKSFATS